MLKFDLFNEQNKKNLKFFFIKKELPLCDYQIKILIYNKIIKSNNTVICKEIIINLLFYSFNDNLYYTCICSWGICALEFI